MQSLLTSQWTNSLTRLHVDLNNIFRKCCSTWQQSYYLCKRKRKIIAYKDYFKDFYASLDKATQEKVLYVLMLLKTQDRLPVKFIKSIGNGLYELRIEYNGNIYRIFFVFDNGSVVVLFNCFQKKTQKTPASEIKKAIKLKEEYYGSKSKQ